MHKLLSLWVILFLCSCTSDFSESEIKSAPNFIIIYADDMGYSDFGPLSDGKIKTPNLDILAKGGQTWTIFTQLHQSALLAEQLYSPESCQFQLDYMAIKLVFFSIK